MNLADWRRLNVNNFVKYCAFSIKTIKPWVQFGISPFGVWRNKSVDPRGSDTNSGQTNYDDLFAVWHGWKTAGLTTYFHNYIGVSTIKRLLMQN
jgi:uncharacterized lipoprotein YddW (UPF0748 family)